MMPGTILEMYQEICKRTVALSDVGLSPQERRATSTDKWISFVGSPVICDQDRKQHSHHPKRPAAAILVGA